VSGRRPDFADLVATMARLRAPGGCPWDRAQTPASLRPYLLEEAYETLDAIEGGAPDRLKEELGDLLLQVVFHAEIAAEAGAFTIDDVVAGLVEKLIRRHPHVFGAATAATPDAVVTRWEAIKQAERADARAAGEPEASETGDGDAGALAGLTRTLPALMLAQQMLVRAARAGFEAPDGAGPEGAVAAARRALDAVTRTPGPAATPDEAVGDLLFATSGVARSLNVDGELALRAACERYRARFARLEALARARGKSLADCTPDDLTALWREAREAR
jgi:tetrapyrrole methylase family protein / MazG family protein